VVPADQLIEEVAAVSGPLKKYRVRTKNGVDTVLKLSEADAAKLGDGPYEVFDAVSTIEPVTAVGDDDEGDDGGDPSDAAAAMADAGVVVTEGLAVGLTGAESVQSPQEPGGDGQATGDASASGGDPDNGQPEVKTEGDGQAAAAEPVAAEAKAPAKRGRPSANKARTSAANKAADSAGG
jgi:hypothetical protein